jgi:hypothetical protein
MHKTVLMLCVLGSLGGCAHESTTSEDSQEKASSSGRAVSLPRAKPGSLLSRVDQSRLKSQLQKAPGPINVRNQCSFHDDTGYHGSNRVEIVNGEVRSLTTQISVPDRGSCSFETSGFRQTQRTPSIEMRSPGDGCTVRIWQQGQQVTISYTHCAQRCTSAEAFKYVWPVLVNTGSGSCS